MKQFTSEKVKKIREHSKNLTIKQIAEKYQRSYHTIFYWIKGKGKDKLPDPFRIKGKPFKKKIVNKENCVRCNNKKIDLKWIKTSYCSLKCFASENN